ncbi:MAG TPA: phosphatase PAP2 family protein [Tepidisphaeraceae bacterium]|jgi:membrane-associated phospholipid phosphatase
MTQTATPTPEPLSPAPKCCTQRCWIWAIILLIVWIAAIVIAYPHDAQIANSVERFTTNAKTGQVESIGVLSKYTLPAKCIRFMGNFRFTLGVAILLYIFHPRKWRASILLVAAAVIGGIIYQFSKWIIGRQRPQYHEPYTFHHFTDGLRGFFMAERLSMPSGHAMLAFATATVLTVCLPRWWALFFVLACVVGAERVLEHSHYLSDVIAGAGVGVIAAMLAKLILSRRCCQNVNQTPTQA